DGPSVRDGWEPDAERLLSPFRGDGVRFGSFEVAAERAIRCGPRRDDGKERMIVATRDGDRGYGPIPRGVADRQRQHEGRDQAECMICVRSLDGPVERGAEV